MRKSLQLKIVIESQKRTEPNLLIPCRVRNFTTSPMRLLRVETLPLVLNYNGKNISWRIASILLGT